MTPRKRWAKRIAIGLAAVLIGLPLLFALTAWIGSSIPRNSDWAEPDEGIEIFIGTNGVHTEIAMPVATDIIDWRGQFPVGDIGRPERPYTHVSVSWGERTFFLETPTWADLDPVVGAGALMGGEGLMHVAWYVRPAPDEDYRPMRITREQYRALVSEIAAQLAAEEERAIFPGYAEHDVFYGARGTYHLGNTCNQWSSDRLANAGIKTGWWTPLTGGVMKWVPSLDSD